MKLANWGNYPVIEAETRRFRREEELRDIIKGSKSLIARGLGRCYGDSALAGNVVSSLNFNRLVYFNETDGSLECEAGVSLAEILDIFVPRGWFLPVTPGTKFVTVGGAIASDVHGKNHHLSGSISKHIEFIEVMTADGEILTCGPNNNRSLFQATCGGMGLTGIILRAGFKLIPIETAYIRQESVKAKNLTEVIDLFEESKKWTYSVAWIDCLSRGESFGRSILMRGEHALAGEAPTSEQKNDNPLQPKNGLKLNVPIFIPGPALNRLSVKAFNLLYYHKQFQKIKKSIVSFDQFFYPLDSIHNWNRIYGKKGFAQYQFVIPKEASKKGLPKILKKISEQGMGSFLTVLKLFGRQDDLISFPMEGFTLALDFPIRNNLFSFLDELDKMVLDYGGRLYLTKDARMSKRVFQSSYPYIEKFMEYKNKFDPLDKFQSLQSQRLMGV